VFAVGQRVLVAGTVDFIQPDLIVTRPETIVDDHSDSSETLSYRQLRGRSVGCVRIENKIRYYTRVFPEKKYNMLRMGQL